MMLHVISFIFVCAALLSSLLLPCSLFAETAKNPTIDKALQESATVTLNWLKLLDKQLYQESWDESSVLMKHTIGKEEWVKILEKTRKPLGSSLSRDVVDQRTAKDPSGLPKGDYMVLFYRTEFPAKKEAYELITLYLEEGKWRVLTYQVDAK